MNYKYRTIASQGKWIIRRTHYENMCIFDEYFTGYDYMGSANWTDSCISKSIQEMDKDEAEQICKDLEAADDLADSERFLVTMHNTDTHCIFHELMLPEQFKEFMTDHSTMDYIKILSVVQIDDQQAFIHK